MKNKITNIFWQPISELWETFRDRNDYDDDLLILAEIKGRDFILSATHGANETIYFDNPQIHGKGMLNAQSCYENGELKITHFSIVCHEF